MSSEPGSPAEAEAFERERIAYEEQLARITSAEMMLQAVLSLLSIAGRRLNLQGPVESASQGTSEPAGAPDAGDLEQVRDAIDGVMALLPILERRLPQELAPLRAALSQLQFAYARASQALPGTPVAPGSGTSASEEPGASTPSAGANPPAADAPPGAPGDAQRGPGPAESSGRLWVPGR